MMNARDRIAREFRFDILGQVPGLRRYARSLARTEIDAEDLVRDALVHAYEKTRELSSRTRSAGLVMSILHNVFVDGTRARRAEAQRIARVGGLLSSSFHLRRITMYAFVKFDKLSSRFPTSSVRHSFSSPSKG